VFFSTQERMKMHRLETPLEQLIALYCVRVVVFSILFSTILTIFYLHYRVERHSRMERRRTTFDGGLRVPLLAHGPDDQEQELVQRFLEEWSNADSAANWPSKFCNFIRIISTMGKAVTMWLWQLVSHVFDVFGFAVLVVLISAQIHIYHGADRFAQKFCNGKSIAELVQERLREHFRWK